MKWNKQLVTPENIPAIIQQGMTMAKTGNPLVNQIRCVFTLEDKKVVYMIPLLDYIDNPPEQISKLYLYS